MSELYCVGEGLRVQAVVVNHVRRLRGKSQGSCGIEYSIDLEFCDVAHGGGVVMEPDVPEGSGNIALEDIPS